MTAVNRQNLENSCNIQNYRPFIQGLEPNLKEPVLEPEPLKY